LATLYPIVGVTGPRQSGKTTLAKFLFPSHAYVSLENLDTRFHAENDPRGFLSAYDKGAIFDEVQHVPHLLSYLQENVDINPTKGRFILTGSQNFSLSSHISQSLSGRVGMLTLLPLSLCELSGSKDVEDMIFEGGYPGLHTHTMHPLDFYPSYIQTYVERDVRLIKNIENLTLFQRFMKLCAGRVGQLVNFSSLAQDAGISQPTARQWISVLEASYILFTLPPYFENFNKRLTKMPKLYFYDTGLACALLGLEAAHQVKSHYLTGGLFENLMVLELLKQRLHTGRPSNLYFWRDRTGQEVDILGDWGGGIHAFEIKRGSTFQESYLKNLQSFCQIASKASQKEINASLLYTGEREGLYKGIHLVPMKRMQDLLWTFSP
jgi:hypothetical protein